MSGISLTTTGGAIEALLAAKQSATATNVAYAVAGKAMDAQRAAGDAAIELITSAAALSATGDKGRLIDVVR